MLRSLVGSEMCIRDSQTGNQDVQVGQGVTIRIQTEVDPSVVRDQADAQAVSYTHLTLPTIYSV